MPGAQEPSETTPLLQNGSDIHPERPTSPTATAPPKATTTQSNGTNPLQSPDQSALPPSSSSLAHTDPNHFNPPAPASTNQQSIHPQMSLIFPTIALGVFLSSADGTLAAASSARIGSDLAALQSTNWIATAYFLSLSAMQPLYGRLADVFGRRACLLFAYAVFAAGNWGCGAAASMVQLCVARGVAGIGGGGMTTVVSILLSDIVPLRDRGQWQGYVNVVWSAGAACGAPLGGLLADTVGWRWGFWAQVPCCVVAFGMVWVFLEDPHQVSVGEDWKTKITKIDFLGAFALLAAVATLLLGLDVGSNQSWRNTLAIALFGSSIPLFVIFLLIEVYVASAPFAPGHIIFNKSILSAYLCNFFGMACQLAVMFYLPLYLQAVYEMSALDSGMYMIPVTVCVVCGSLFGGWIMKRTGKFYVLTIYAYIGSFIGVVLLVMFSGLIVSSKLGIVLAAMICSTHTGIAVTTSLIAIIANASKEDQAVATACSYLFRSLGSAVGTSLAATAVNQTLKSTLRKNLVGFGNPDEIADMVRQSLDVIQTFEPSIRKIVRESYSLSVRTAYQVEAVVVLGAIISSWFIKEVPLN